MITQEKVTLLGHVSHWKRPIRFASCTKHIKQICDLEYTRVRKNGVFVYLYKDGLFKYNKHKNMHKLKNIS